MKNDSLWEKKSIHFIYTWWTIFSDNTAEGAQVVNTENKIKKIKEIAESLTMYDDKELMAIDSSSMTPERWIQIVQEIEQKEKKDPLKYNGYVIIHWTDTMEYTASALSFMIQWLRKPIIITWSMKGIEEKESDAPNNVISAIIAAKSTELPGVFIAFWNKLIQGNKAKKTDTGAYDTFSSQDKPSIWKFKDDSQWYKKLKIKSDKASKYDLLSYQENYFDLIKTKGEKIFDTLETRVEIVKLHPSCNLEIFDFLIQKWIKWIVLEGYGDGNVPDIKTEYGKKFYEKIQSCVESGMFIVLKSQCNTWNCDHKYSWANNLFELNKIWPWAIVSWYNMTTPAAYTKLMRSLKNGNPKEDMKKNISWELL